MVIMRTHTAKEAGFTLVELTVSLCIMAVMSLSVFGLYLSLVNSTLIAKRMAVANTLAINQMEYLKSLPYDSLIAQSASPLTETKKVNSFTYMVVTGIRYADDAYDGCANYPDLNTKKRYCRNYPPPSGAPATDTNPADYKGVNVTVYDKNDKRLAMIDTQISARVAETASTTGALTVRVFDPSGQGIADATVNVKNITLTPTVSKQDKTDGFGTAIFYGLPPDSGADYSIQVNKTGYSSLTTIVAAGGLTPNYPNQRILAQQPSEVTLILAPMTTNSLLLETVDTNGAPLPGVKVYVKGGYKKYTLDTNKAYYFDTMTPDDTRPETDGSGLAGVADLAPIGDYTFCGDDGATNCKVGTTTYYLLAALPYAGTASLGPITLPPYDPANTDLFTYNGNAYQQKVRLIMTANSALPRAFTVTPDFINMSNNVSNVKFTVAGKNLSTASISLKQGATVYPNKNCVSTDISLTCGFDLSTATAGEIEMSITNSAGTVVLPISPLGGIHVKP
jgi:type II secretory pathway pseudopilin PulG